MRERGGLKHHGINCSTRSGSFRKKSPSSVAVVFILAKNGQKQRNSPYFPGLDPSWTKTLVWPKWKLWPPRNRKMSWNRLNKQSKSLQGVKLGIALCQGVNRCKISKKPLFQVLFFSLIISGVSETRITSSFFNFVPSAIGIDFIDRKYSRVRIMAGKRRDPDGRSAHKSLNIECRFSSLECDARILVCLDPR